MSVKVDYTCTYPSKNKGDLKIFQDPYIHSKIIGYVKPGTKDLNVPTADKEWYFVTNPSSGKAGWTIGKNNLTVDTKSGIPFNIVTPAILQIDNILIRNDKDSISEALKAKNKDSEKNTKDVDYEDDPNGKSTQPGLTVSNKTLKAMYKEAKPDIKSLILSNGIAYSPQTFQWFTKFKRIPMVDPYNTLKGNTKEYLFFIKPDLNIIDNSGTKTDPKYTLSPGLKHDPFFMDLAANNFDVIRMLQYHALKKPFCNLLQCMVQSNLAIQNIEAETIETAANIQGTSIDLRGDGHKSSEDLSFSLEFGEIDDLSVYKFFKAYDRYIELKKKGLVSPPLAEYRTAKILHDRMGIYKIVVGEDGETIIYWAYYWGVYPVTVPRDAFSEVDPMKHISYNIDFKAPFVDDMDPIILRDFNRLAKEQVGASIWNNPKKIIPLFNTKTQRVDGRWAVGPKIVVIPDNGKHRYVLQWLKG